MRDFELGSYYYMVDHDRRTVERFKLASSYKSENDGVDNYLFVNENVMSVMSAGVADDSFLSGEDIYSGLFGDDAA